jgi:hypothetical protein
VLSCLSLIPAIALARHYGRESQTAHA